MKKSDRYLKIVEWSDEDQCYIGRAPGVMLGGVHGKDEAKVYAELCECFGISSTITMLSKSG